jgi:hypothetical protein
MSDLDEQNDDVRAKGGKSGGASVTQTNYDPRMSTIISWVWGTIASAFVICVGLAAKNLYDLNVNMTRVLDVGAANSSDIKENTADIRQLQQRVSELEHKR